MGLFNKLLDGLGVDSQTVEKFANNLMENAKQLNERREAERQERSFSEAASGDSWGEEMPAEENQYNFGGTYIRYFENIFDNEFSDYRYKKEDLAQTRRTVYTFYLGSDRVLVLELMNEASNANRIRYAAERDGVPYLRFYYDHDGWWNTRSYVTRRIKEAIG